MRLFFSGNFRSPVLEKANFSGDNFKPSSTKTSGIDIAVPKSEKYQQVNNHIGGSLKLTSLWIESHPQVN